MSCAPGCAPQSLASYVVLCAGICDYKSGRPFLGKKNIWLYISKERNAEEGLLYVRYGAVSSVPHRRATKVHAAVLFSCSTHVWLYLDSRIWSLIYERSFFFLKRWLHKRNGHEETGMEQINTELRCIKLFSNSLKWVSYSSPCSSTCLLFSILRILHVKEILLHDWSHELRNFSEVSAQNRRYKLQNARG